MAKILNIDFNQFDETIDAAEGYTPSGSFDVPGALVGMQTPCNQSAWFGGDVIDVRKVEISRYKVAAGLIAPAEEDTTRRIANEHTSEPIRTVEDIRKISDWFLARGRYRDNMLFICGINFGLRVSDLLTLRFADIINEDFTFKPSFALIEKKTEHTRKQVKNRYVGVNEAVIDAVILYLKNTSGVKLSDYMFRSESNRGGNQNKPMHRNSVDRILKEVVGALHINIKVSTHTLRKTFCLHQMIMNNNDPRKLLLLQRMLGHSSSVQTLDYIGITRDEIQNAYMQLNLDGRTDERSVVCGTDIWCK